jgi:hypothetical protein
VGTLKEIPMPVVNNTSVPQRQSFGGSQWLNVGKAFQDIDKLRKDPSSPLSAIKTIGNADGSVMVTLKHGTCYSEADVTAAIHAVLAKDNGPPMFVAVEHPPSKADQKKGAAVDSAWFDVQDQARKASVPTAASDIVGINMEVGGKVAVTVKAGSSWSDGAISSVAKAALAAHGFKNAVLDIVEEH